MNLDRLSMHELWDLERRLDDKIERMGWSWLRDDYAYRVKKIRDKISVHMNRRTWNGDP